MPSRILVAKEANIAAGWLCNGAGLLGAPHLGSVHRVPCWPEIGELVNFWSLKAILTI